MRYIIFLVGVVLLQTSTLFGQKEITLEEIWMMGKFSQDYVYGIRSMNDGLHYSGFERGKNGLEINKYAYETGDKVETIFSTESVEQELRLSGYEFSADESKLLLATESEHIYRHSTRENNYIYDIKSGELTFISEAGKQRYATFSPSGNKVAYVMGNDLYIYDAITNEVTRVTEDGEFNHIINGAVDWVYEEEFSFAKGFFWSPDGKKIAFYKFDESAVREYNMQVWKDELYPEDYKFKYPKAGEDNSKVQVMVYDLATEKLITAAETGEQYEYIPRVKWSEDANLVALQMMNRHQSLLDIYLVNASNGNKEVIYHEEQSAYIEVSDDWTFTDNNEDFIITSDKGGYNHIYQIDLAAKTETQVTKGKWDVTAFHGMDKSTGYLFYTAAETSPMVRDVYRIQLNGKEKEKLSEAEGWNDADFSTGMKYFINTHSTINTPNVITLHDATGKQIRELKTSKRLNMFLEDYELPQKEFFTFKTEQGVKLNAWMLKPANFDESKEYPVLVTIYGGPGSQEVVDQWGGGNHMWHHLLAQKGYIIVSVDNRGTGGRGAEFRKMTYKELGKYETEDYIETAKHLGNLPYVNGDRIGIWGWSYGGYMSSLSITKGADYYKAAIAVAPVTNWRYYDNIYTERYMQTPQENASGYDENSPINFAKELKGNYLLIHGTGDDNVHFQNSIQMVNALINANKQFDFYMYPDRNHGIYGGNTRFHLYEKMTNWLEENL
tara:strand:- start:1914 stop:4085 length:2172 start_codon:yes stop_codon:yes gene_type:complete